MQNKELPQYIYDVVEKFNYSKHLFNNKWVNTDDYKQDAYLRAIEKIDKIESVKNPKGYLSVLISRSVSDSAINANIGSGGSTSIKRLVANIQNNTNQLDENELKVKNKISDKKFNNYKNYPKEMTISFDISAGNTNKPSINEFLEKCDDKSKKILEMMSEGYTNIEISGHLECSQSYVSKKFAQIREELRNRYPYMVNDEEN